jgi:hypothetical protein
MDLYEKTKAGALGHLSTEDLREELKLREELAKRAPHPLPKPDIKSLEEMVLDGIESAFKSGRLPKDFSQYVYEATLRSFYGKNIFKALSEAKIEGD